MELPVCLSRIFSTAGIVSAVLVALIILSGCSSPPVDGGEKPVPPGILVQYQRTDGIAGFSDQIVIFDTGDAVYSRTVPERSGTFNLSDGELTDLEALLEHADFPSLAPAYPAESPGADYFTYTITYDKKTVKTETGGEPPELVPVIMRLDSLLDEHSGSG